MTTIVVKPEHRGLGRHRRDRPAGPARRLLQTLLTGRAPWDIDQRIAMTAALSVAATIALNILGGAL